MSKKVFNILCFALVLCFIGCTELINPKTETDINLNIDLSKIIKSTRNTGETQSSASIDENQTIKVAIYDAKKYNSTTNSTGNLDLITEAQAKIVNNGAKVKLNNIPVGIYAIVFAELSFSNGNSTEVMYAGNSEVFKVKASDNKISLVLVKVVVDDEVKPDDSKPEEIINAKEPIITTQPESHIKIYSSETGEDFTYELKITAESSDNGKISYKWQKLDNENWVDIENSSSEEIKVTVSKNTSCVYRCVVTNTNENVNGKKTASIYSSEVTVAYRENTSVTYAEGLTCKVDSVDTVTLYISSAEGLATFRDIVNGTLTKDISVRYNDNSTSKRDFSAGISQLNINAVLKNDIDLNNVSWTPIGKNSTDGYKGTFDGEKHEIKGLNINSSDANPQGLFCSVNGGTVKNLVVQGSIKSSYFTGGITGYLNGGTIENCVNKASITNSATNGTTGGIVGYVENSTATIKNCVNMAKVESTHFTVGGIVGATGVMSETNVSISISKCINMGEISALSIVAGILGLAYPITIENCINLGKVISTNTTYAAGIVIPSEDDVSVTVTNCINAGNVVNNNDRVGAISTSTNGIYSNNYYDSTVNSNVLNSDIDGITGQLTSELIGSNLSLQGITTDNWSFADGRYPLPNITETIPGGANGEIWSAVIEAATPENTSTSGGESIV
ncbi:MAG: hypothetical protein IJD23_09750 [Spirochaetaceae bacterium]|nr:hypothetical protein [Spirochaetaceae bacterium]